jgi:hypothetical protein
LFTAVLALAADSETPLPTLFAGALRLAYPARADDEVALAVLSYERYLAKPPMGMDKWGNPLWMRLAPSTSGSDRQGRGVSGEIPRVQADLAEEGEVPATGPSKKHFFGKFFSRPGNTAEESMEENRVRLPRGGSGRSSAPVRLIRAAVFVTLFAVLYYCLTEVF